MVLCSGEKIEIKFVHNVERGKRNFQFIPIFNSYNFVVEGVAVTGFNKSFDKIVFSYRGKLNMWKISTKNQADF